MEKTLALRVKETSKEWAESHSMHGLPGIVRNDRKVLKVMWLLFLLLCSVICGFLVYQSIFSYLSFEVFNKYKIIYPSKVALPTISICNANVFQNTQAFSFVENVMAKNGIADPTDVNFGPESYATEVSHLANSYGFVQFISQVNAMNSNVSDATRQSFGANLTDFVLACYFGQSPCSTSDFTWFYDFNYGNCFKLNGEGTKNIFKPGYNNGVQLILLTKIENNLKSFAQSMGSHVFIHNHTIIPYSFEGINVAPGTQTNIAIGVSYLNQLGLPYNSCYKNLVTLDAYDSLLYRSIISNNQTYRQTDCFRLCFQQQVINTCHCYNSNQQKIGDSQPCTTFRQLGCVFGVYVYFFSKNIIDECGDLCPLECDKVSYSASINVAGFPSENFAELLMNSTVVKRRFANDTLSFETLKQNVQSVNIYFNEIKYTLMDQSPSMTLLDLIASIGGTLGLFIGVSFLSSVEFLEILVNIMDMLIDAKAKSYLKKDKKTGVRLQNKRNLESTA